MNAPLNPSVFRIPADFEGKLDDVDCAIGDLAALLEQIDEIVDSLILEDSGDRAAQRRATAIARAAIALNRQTRADLAEARPYALAGAAA